MKKNSTTNQSTEEQKKEELKDEIRSYLNKYENIKNSKYFTYRQKDILSLMLFRGNGQDEGFTMGYKHIMDIFGYSRSTISATIGMLKDYNFISVEKGHTGVNSKYTLNYDAMKSFKSSSTEFDSEIEQDKTSKNRQDKQKQTRQDKASKRTNKVTDNQIDTQVLSNKSDKLDIIIELLKQTLNINNNININLNNLKDIISSNNNTRDQEKKKNISTVNLEILKENSKDENSNDEIIPSGMKDSSEDKDNTSKDKLLYNENPDNENNIPSESRIPSDEGNISDNENPNDMPPLDVDCFFENNFNQPTEYRDNENLNEENETSRDENPSKANENPEDDEISVFGDSNSTDEDKDKDNDKWYESSRSAKSDNHENGMFTNLISELTSNENPKANEISNDNNSKTSENMKKTNNKTNTIPSEGKNPSDENPKANENLNAFGKLQSFRDLKTGRIDGYQFNSYDNLNDSRDYSKSFHASVLCLNLEPSDLNKVSVSDTGVWGILNRTNGVYSFIPSSVGPSYASNNALQGDETSNVDNHTAEGEKVAPEQSQIANKASECNNDTTANDKGDEKDTETVYADEKNAEVDNYTVNTEITAGNSVKMRPEPSDSNINTTDACYDMYGISTDELNDIIGHHHGNGKGAWRNMKIRLHNEETTISKALEHFKDKKEDGKEFMECNTFFYYYNPICIEIDRLIREGKMTEEQKNDCITIFGKLTRGKFAYWRKVFTTRPPRPNFPSEQEMWKLLGCPQVTNKTVHKTDNVVNNNKVYEDNVILPTHKDFESMSLDEIKNTLLTFVQEHPNLSDDKKAYINNLCIAYTLEPQYVA